MKIISLIFVIFSSLQLKATGADEHTYNQFETRIKTVFDNFDNNFIRLVDLLSNHSIRSDKTSQEFLVNFRQGRSNIDPFLNPSYGGDSIPRRLKQFSTISRGLSLKEINGLRESLNSLPDSMKKTHSGIISEWRNKLNRIEQFFQKLHVASAIQERNFQVAKQIRSDGKSGNPVPQHFELNSEVRNCVDTSARMHSSQPFRIEAEIGQALINCYTQYVEKATAFANTIYYKRMTINSRYLEAPLEIETPKAAKNPNHGN